MQCLSCVTMYFLHFQTHAMNPWITKWFIRLPTILKHWSIHKIGQGSSKLKHFQLNDGNFCDIASYLRLFFFTFFFLFGLVWNWGAYIVWVDSDSNAKLNDMWILCSTQSRYLAFDLFLFKCYTHDEQRASFVTSIKFNERSICNACSGISSGNAMAREWVWNWMHGKTDDDHIPIQFHYRSTANSLVVFYAVANNNNNESEVRKM